MSAQLELPNRWEMEAYRQGYRRREVLRAMQPHRQKTVLDFIRARNERGKAPTSMEIREHMQEKGMGTKDRSVTLMLHWMVSNNWVVMTPVKHSKRYWIKEKK